MRTLKIGAVASALAIVLSACAEGGAEDAMEESAEVDSTTQEENTDNGTDTGLDLTGVNVGVGGKEFTEQLILCEITALVMEDLGADVNRSCSMSGSATVRAALESGDIDMYWEYTGTGWISHLQEEDPILDPNELWLAVDERDQEQNQITWLTPAPANNTYAVAVASEVGEELGITSISDYAELANANPSEATFCGAAEFFGRNDGWPGLQETYGFELPREDTSEVAYGAIFNAVDTQNPCNFGEVFATDGRIAALDLTVLSDDLQFFTPYNPSVSVRSELLEANPGLAEVFEPISAAMTDNALQGLNAEVDVDGLTPEDVAVNWLTSEGFIGS